MYNDFAKIYDRLIADDFDYDEAENFIMDNLRKYHVNYENFLDNGCGTGNMTQRIMKYFERGFACDISYDMISQASSKFSMEEKSPQFSVQSAEKLLITDGFNLIYSVMDIPNYLGKFKFEKYLSNSFKSLREGGLLIFDISGEYKIRNILGNEIYINSEEDLFYCWKNAFHSEENNEFVDCDIEFFIKEDGLDSYDRINEYQRMYLFEDKFIRESALRHGFEILSVTDGYSTKEVHDKSIRLTYVLRRKNNG